MANQDAAFGLRPLKTFGAQDDSTGMSSHKISPGDTSAIYQGSLVGSPATGTGYIDIQHAVIVLEIALMTEYITSPLHLLCRLIQVRHL